MLPGKLEGGVRGGLSQRKGMLVPLACGLLVTAGVAAGSAGSGGTGSGQPPRSGPQKACPLVLWVQNPCPPACAQPLARQLWGLTAVGTPR